MSVVLSDETVERIIREYFCALSIYRDRWTAIDIYLLFQLRLVSWQFDRAWRKIQMEIDWDQLAYRFYRGKFYPLREIFIPDAPSLLSFVLYCEAISAWLVDRIDALLPDLEPLSVKRWKKNRKQLPLDERWREEHDACALEYDRIAALYKKFYRQYADQTLEWYSCFIGQRTDQSDIHSEQAVDADTPASEMPHIIFTDK